MLPKAALLRYQVPKRFTSASKVLVRDDLRVAGVVDDDVKLAEGLEGRLHL